MKAAKNLADLTEAQDGGPGSNTGDTLTGVPSTPGGGADRPRSPSKLLSRLEKRIANDKARSAAEKQRLREIEAKKVERQFRTIGEICCKAAAVDADFAAALRLVLSK